MEGIEKEGSKLNRRELLGWARKAGLAVLVSKALTACATKPDNVPAAPSFENMEGKLVPLSKILSYPIPTEEWEPMVEMIDDVPVVVVVNKDRLLYGLYVNSKLVRIGVAGTARRSAGYYTTDGAQKITRLEGEGYTSGEYDDAKMDWATFFDERGRAMHASSNYIFRTNRETGKKEWHLRVDSSHGCINLMDEDAEYINKTVRAHNMQARVQVY